MALWQFKQIEALKFDFNSYIYRDYNQLNMQKNKEVNELVVNRLKKQRKEWRADHPFGFVAKPIQHAQMALRNTRPQRHTLGSRKLYPHHGLRSRLPSQTTQMRVQARIAPSQYLPLWHSLPLHSQRRRRLETSYFSQTNSLRNSKIVEGLTKHRKSRSTVTTNSLQKQQRIISQKSQNICKQQQEKTNMIIYVRCISNYYSNQLQISQTAIIQLSQIIICIIIQINQLIENQIRNQLQNNSVSIINQEMFGGGAYEMPSNGKKVTGLARKNQFSLGWDINDQMNDYQNRKSKKKQITGKITVNEQPKRMPSYDSYEYQSIAQGSKNYEQQLPQKLYGQQQIPRNYDQRLNQPNSIPSYEQHYNGQLPNSYEKYPQQYSAYRPIQQQLDYRNYEQEREEQLQRRYNQELQKKIQQYDQKKIPQSIGMERRAPIKPKQSMKDIIYNNVGTSGEKSSYSRRSSNILANGPPLEAYGRR